MEKKIGKILHVITGLDEGGAQRYLLLHCENEAGSEHKVVYLTGRGLYTSQFQRIGVDVFALGVTGPVSGIRGLFRLRSLIVQHQPQVVVAWMYHAILAAMAAFSGKPVIWNIRQTYSGRAREKRRTYMVLRLLALLSKHAAAIVYNSHVARASHEALGYAKARAKVIHNGVSLKPAKAACVDRLRSQFLPSGKGCVIVNLGRYHSMKGQQDFAMIAAEILERHDDVVFVAVGAGVPEHREALLTELPDAVRDRFITLGHTDDPGLLLWAANIYLGTSLWGEAYPNSVAEAVVRGCHVLATDVGDTSDIIRGAGTLLTPGDTRQAVAALDSMLVNGSWSERNVPVANRVLALEDATRSYQSLYDQVRG